MKEENKWVRIVDYALKVLAFMFLILTGLTPLILLAVMDEHYRTQRRYRKWKGEKEWRKLMKEQ